MGIYNEKILESRRRDLRVKQTEAEKILWQKLRRPISGGDGNHEFFVFARRSA